MVSSGCPTSTCAAPPKLPAMSSLTVSSVLCGMPDQVAVVSEKKRRRHD